MLKVPMTPPTLDSKYSGLFGPWTNCSKPRMHWNSALNSSSFSSFSELFWLKKTAAKKTAITGTADHKAAQVAEGCRLRGRLLGVFTPAEASAER